MRQVRNGKLPAARRQTAIISKSAAAVFAAVHDIATPAIRQRDLDIADTWELLANAERVLSGEATVYDFVEPAGRAHE